MDDPGMPPRRRTAGPRSASAPACRARTCVTTTATSGPLPA